MKRLLALAALPLLHCLLPGALPAANAADAPKPTQAAPAPAAARAVDPLPRAASAEVGMSADRLARIRTALEAEVQANRLPGAVVAIARHGRLTWYEAIGYQDRARGTPMPLDAIFPIASMTKPLAGVAALLLLEEGKLNLGDPIGRFYPELGRMPVAVLDEAVLAGTGPIPTVPARRQFTILDLMRHTSGLTYGGRGRTAVHKAYPASSNASADSLTGPEFIARLAGLPLLHQPGTVWDYSLSTDVLGLVVEQVSGQRLGDFLGARVFQPLGMVDSGFALPAEKRPRLAVALPTDPETGRPQAVPDRAAGAKFDCGGGCALSTAADYLRFAQMLLAGGRLDEVRILGPRTVRMMATDHMTPEIQNNVGLTDPTKDQYGFGLTVAVQPAHGGQNIPGNPGVFTWSGAFGTHFWVDPTEDMAVVFMAQAPGAIRQYYRRVITNLVYQAILD